MLAQPNNIASKATYMKSNWNEHAVRKLSCFCLGYYVLDEVLEFGDLQNAAGEVTHDYWYFSFVAYTSLGFGDITPRGSLRFMTAMETLTGLVLIAWTASFIYLEMQTNWNADASSGADNAASTQADSP